VPNRAKRKIRGKYPIQTRYNACVDFQESVVFLSTLRRFAPDRTRERFRQFLAHLGSPHQGQHYLHVVGTNGKGSTCTFLTSALLEMGYTVGTYLSPYVFEVGERIQYNGVNISDDDLARLATHLRPFIEETPLLEFEAKTALAFLYFAEKQPDFIVLEAGIGGKWDSTNVIEAPLLAIITSIGLDHQSILGDTRAQIAAEKAGIVKPGTLACVTPVVDTEAAPVIAQICQTTSVPLVQSHEYEGKLRLRGAHQKQNAGLAETALRTLQHHNKIAFTEAQLAAGLANAHLPGRFQVIESAGKTLILDVAHNAESAQVLVDALQECFPRHKKTFVVGMSQNHEPTPFLTLLRSQITRLIVTEPNFRPLPAADLAVAAREIGFVPSVQTPAAEAILSAWESCSIGEVVVVTGSFYTVGETPLPLRQSAE
jgi:dihydrofolate synthase / folylpolyglutamate synthase